MWKVAYLSFLALVACAATAGQLEHAEQQRRELERQCRDAREIVAASRAWRDELCPVVRALPLVPETANLRLACVKAVRLDELQELIGRICQ